MSWRLLWTVAAERSLQRIPWQDAARVDAAVMRYAATGRGTVRRLPTDNAVTIRLRVDPYRVRITMDPFEGVMWVWWVYRADRP